MKESSMPDVGTLPSSGGASLDKDGIRDSGYLDKKGTPSGMEAKFNKLPPGTNIEVGPSATATTVEPVAATATARGVGRRSAATVSTGS